MQLWIIEFELVLNFYNLLFFFRCQGQCVHHLKWICGQINLNVSLDTHSFIYCLFIHFKNILLTMRFIAQWSFSPFIFWHSLHDDDLHFLHIHINSSSHLAFVSFFFLREEPVCSLFIHQKLSSSGSCEMRKTCSKEGGR